MKGRGDSGTDRTGKETLNNLRPKPFNNYSRTGREWIGSILLISTAYDLFLLQEEGRLSDHFRERYIRSGSLHIPVIDHAPTATEGLDAIKRKRSDLVVIFNPPGDMEIAVLVAKIRESSPESRIAFLASDTPELRRLIEGPSRKDLDIVMAWNGDGTILETLVRMVEDLSLKLDPDPMMNPAGIMILSENPRIATSAAQIISDTAFDQFGSLIGSDPTPVHRRTFFDRRPRPLMAKDEEHALSLIEDPSRRIIGFITEEGHFPELLPVIYSKTTPILQISDGNGSNRKIADNISNIGTESDNVDRELRIFVRDLIMSVDLSNEDKCLIEGPLNDARSLQRACESHGSTDIPDLIDQKDLLDWLLSLWEFELAKLVSVACKKGVDISCSEMGTAIKHLRVARSRGSVMDFSRSGFPEDINIMRIGKGPMGGKARGLTFMDRIICSSMDDRFTGVELSIPKMIIICTDIFDRFMEENDLLDDELMTLSDERITERFLSANLPTTLSGELRSVVRSMRGPLSIRSSSLLEDAIFQPFAGVYASLMVPGSNSSEDERFKELARAVKYIYASTYFKEARDYIKATDNRIEEEKMGVIIQMVSGKKHGDLFYPDISGVARSHDYWPLPGCGREEGTVSVALGLGKTIVDGMGGWKFCPARPQVTLFNDIKDIMDSTQRTFIALHLGSRIPGTHPEESTTLKTLDLETAIDHGTADLLVSTLDPSSGRFYPGPFRDGPKVVDLAPILKEGALPLPSVIRGLLEAGEEGLGGPVEIEFTANIDSDNRTMKFDLLQIRSMVARWDTEGTDLTPSEGERVIISSKKVLGNGVDSSCSDLILVSEDRFDISRSREVAREVSSMNSRMMKEKKPYILIGPGRWGTSDEWMGIPVNWSDVSGARTIVETPLKGRIIDQSQGSHFFQNLSSLKRSYFTLSMMESSSFDHERLMENGKVEEGRFLTRIHIPGGIICRIDGESGRGTISICMDEEAGDAG